ncbi:MAG: hypothetical protein ACFE9L_21460 [Candidatus Hodarchaeota archaeon]
MIFLLTVWIPPDKALETAKIYLEQPRVIPHIRKLNVFNTTGGEDGNKQYHLIMTERGKDDEGLQSIFKFMIPITNVEGVCIQIEVLMGVTDSYKLFGMDWD